MLFLKHAYGKADERPEVTAAAGAAGPPMVQTGAAVGERQSGRNVNINREEVTPEGAEKLRRLMSSIAERLNEAGATAKAAGESPPSATTAPDRAA